MQTEESKNRRVAFICSLLFGFYYVSGVSLGAGLAEMVARTRWDWYFRLGGSHFFLWGYTGFLVASLCRDGLASKICHRAPQERQKKTLLRLRPYRPARLVWVLASPSCLQAQFKKA